MKKTLSNKQKNNRGGYEMKIIYNKALLALFAIGLCTPIMANKGLDLLGNALDGISYDLRRIDEKDEKDKTTAEKTFERIGLRAFEQVAEAAVGEVTHEANQRKAALEMAKAKKQAGIDAAKRKAEFQAFNDIFLTKDNITRLTGAGIGLAGGVYFFRNVMPIMRQMLENYLFTPPLIDETSVKSPVEKFIKQNVLKEKKQKSGIEELHFDPELQAQVDHIVASYKRIGKHKNFFLNYLFYGEPGTGKTATARAIALESGLDYAMMSGGNVQKLLKSGKAEEKLKDVFNWASASKNGLILFIDEADAFLKDPNKHEMTEELYAVLNSFLNLTGTESKTISLIFSTNHPNQLPKAVIDRVGPGQFIYFGLPQQEQRVQIINQFVPKYFTASKRAAFTPEIVNEIARKLDGFSGRNISYCMLSLSQQQVFAGSVFDQAKLHGFIDRAVEQSKMKNTFHTFA